MPYQNQQPQIDEQALEAYGRRQYQDFEASKARLNQLTAGKYGRPKGEFASRQILSIAAAFLLLITAYWLLKPQVHSPETQLASFLQLEQQPLPTLGLSGFRSNDHPSDKEAAIQQALLPYINGDFETAISALKPLAQSPNSPALLHLYLGHAYFQNEQYQEASSQLQQAVTTLNPQAQSGELLTSRYWRAKAYAAAGDCDLAQNDLQYLLNTSNEFQASARELQLLCADLLNAQP